MFQKNITLCCPLSVFSEVRTKYHCMYL
uniref:Uncharacterized protein n=1 Tax=Anguilla anguilla TaxID=7936 RepID=A0A0E9VR22_ANGAN